MSSEVEKPTFTNDAFISYSRKDREFAATLEKALRNYKPPKGLNLPPRNLVVFRDEEDFTGVEYHASLERHLKNSRKMIVICSPHARKSDFVNDEIRHFAQERGKENIIPVLLSGIPNNEAKPEQKEETAFPEALCEVMEMPLAASYISFNAKKDRVDKRVFYGPWYKILADLYDISRNEIEERDKKRQIQTRNRWIAGTGIVILILAVALIFALVSRQHEMEARVREAEHRAEAIKQRDAAIKAQKGEEDQRKNAEASAVEARKQRDIANHQREEADRQRKVAEERFKIARSRQLATQALAVLNNRFDLALLLSVEANRTYRTFEASNALFSALTSNPHLTTFLRGHPGRVTSVAFSPDGSLLAAGTCDAFGDYVCKQGVIALWDTRSRKLTRAPLRGHINGISQVGFSPDGKLLVSASEDGTIILWDVVNGQQKGKYFHGAAPIVFSQNAAMLASAECIRWSGSCEKWIVTIRETADVQSSRKFESESKTRVTSIAFSPDGKILAEGRIDGLISLWDLDDGSAPKRSFIGHQGVVSGLAFTPDGRVLISGGADKAVAFWDTKSGEVISKPKVEHQSDVLGIALDPTGRRLLSTSRDKTVVAWDIESYRPVERYEGRMTTLDNVAFSPDGKTVAWGGHENTVAVWDLSLKQPLGEIITRHTGRVWSVSFSRTGEMLASAGWHDGIHLWMVQQGKPGPYVLGKGGYSVAFGPDGRTLAVAEGRSFRLWNATSGEPLCEPLREHGDRVVSLAFSPDGKLVASASHDHTVRLWDTNRKQQADLPLKGRGHNGRVNSVAFSPDSAILASGGDDERVILWDIASRRPLGKPLAGHRDGVMSLAFSPNGRTLAVATKSASTGTRSGRIFLWDLTTGTCSREPLTVDEPTVESVVFSPDGRLLAAGDSSAVTLWNTDTYQRIGAPLRAHRKGVYSVAFSPDSHKLASAGGDGLVILWDVSPDSWQTRACRLAGRDLSREEWARFLPETPYRKTCLPDVDNVAR